MLYNGYEIKVHHETGTGHIFDPEGNYICSAQGFKAIREVIEDDMDKEA